MVHQVAINEMGKTRPVASNNQDHPLLNYLSENTPSKLKNDFMLVDHDYKCKSFDKFFYYCHVLSFCSTSLIS